MSKRYRVLITKTDSETNETEAIVESSYYPKDKSLNEVTLYSSNKKTNLRAVEALAEIADFVLISYIDEE